eukprot:GILJ01000435.1.p1 GENE.GILJ01000435.1~~GILJ01000435.1.p1  ORF type:complete len:438 (+),score=108.38 GILJ01000435.1:184-1314(+)
MNPLGKIPVLETENGAIFESNAIARYVARMRADTGLYGATFFEAGQVEQWIDYTVSEVETPAAALVYPVFGWIPYDANVAQQATSDLKKAFAIINDHLLTHTYLVGNQVTLADVILACTLILPFRTVVGPEFRKPYGNLVRWLDTLVHLPEFVAVWGRVDFAKVAQSAVGAPAPAAKPKKEAAKKEEKPKAEPKPKAEKPKADEEMDEDDEPKAKRQANPLDSLPPSTMVLDEWKKVYSNTRDLYGEAMPKFWSMLDTNGYSLWFCEYNKAAGEGEVLFMTLNLVSGFLQRLDKLRKYAFGSMGVYGVEPNLEIEGCWLFRGQEIPFEMKDHPSFEYYNFRRVDLSSAADKKLVEDYWCSEEEVRGKKYRETKIYK